MAVVVSLYRYVTVAVVISLYRYVTVTVVISLYVYTRYYDCSYLSLCRYAVINLLCYIGILHDIVTTSS